MNAPQTHAGPKPGPAAAAYRQLVMKGLAPQEAANVVATIAGIPIVAQPWTLREVNHLVFLRTLRVGGRWGDGQTALAELPPVASIGGPSAA